MYGLIYLSLLAWLLYFIISGYILTSEIFKKPSGPSKAKQSKAKHYGGSEEEPPGNTTTGQLNLPKNRLETSGHSIQCRKSAW